MKSRHPICKIIILSILEIPAFYCSLSHAESPVIEQGEDTSTGLKYWLWDNGGFYLRLTQRLPDQTRAYFESRGFDQASSEIAGVSCIFQTMIKNSGTEPSATVTADLTEWQVINGNKKQPMLLREYWKKLWLDRNQTESARIAFEWSLLPTTVHYDINDYNWGMSSYGLEPGSHFDLHFSWHRGGKRYTGMIKDVICADDIHPDPPSQ